MRIVIALIMSMILTVSVADSLPYDEVADGHKQIEEASQKSKKANMPLIVIFGANWCGDCRSLDAAMSESSVKQFLSKKFKIVKIDVGEFNKGADIAGSYGIRLKSGIPVGAIVSQKGDVVYVFKPGELDGVARMDSKSIYEYFLQVSGQVKN